MVAKRNPVKTRAKAKGNDCKDKKWNNININWHLMHIDYLEAFYINELHTAKNAKKKKKEIIVT